MPKPKKGEPKKKYVARAIPEMIEEGLKPNQAAGKAFGWWRNVNKTTKKKATTPKKRAKK